MPDSSGTVKITFPGGEIFESFTVELAPESSSVTPTVSELQVKACIEPKGSILIHDDLKYYLFFLTHETEFVLFLAMLEKPSDHELRQLTREVKSDVRTPNLRSHVTNTIM